MALVCFRVSGFGVLGLGFRAGTVQLDVETKCRGMVLGWAGHGVGSVEDADGRGWAGHGVGSVEVEFELEEQRQVRGLGLGTGLGKFSVWGY